MNIIGKFTLILSFLCFVSAPSLKWALGGWMPFMGVLLLFAGLFFGLSVLSNWRFYKNLFRSESLHFLGASASFGVVLFVFLIAMNYMVHRNNVILDLTENKVNSLTEFTSSVLLDLDKDLYFYFLSSGSEKNKKEEAFVKNILSQFQKSNSLIHYQTYSIYENPEKASEFKLGHDESALFAVYGEKKHRLRAVNESHITNAILRLTKKSKKIYVLQGHGERLLSDSGTYGLKSMQDELERLYYEVFPLEGFEIPKDASFVAIIGPRMSYPDEGLDKLRAYVRSGGSLLIAIDPGEAHNLALLTKSFGIEFQNTFAYSTSKTMGLNGSNLSIFIEPTQSSHELLRSFNTKSRPLFFISSPLKAVANDLSSVKITPFLRYNNNSLIKSEMSETAPVIGDGGQTAGIVVEGDNQKNPYFRVLAFGDSDFLTNQFFSQHANFTLALNSIGFLSKDEDMVKLKPRIAKTTYLLLTQTQLNFYILLFILPLPLLYFLFAIFFRFRRNFS